MSWSRHGYENASYCISHTGRQPAMHRPTAAPSMPASANGVSTHRFSPKRSRSPAVARNTPPARPTSSPITITFSSRASSTCSASFTASTRSLSVIETFAQVRRRDDVRVLEQQLRIGIRLCLRRGDACAHRLRCLGLYLGLELVAQDAEAAEVALVPAETLVLLLLLDPLEIDVRAWIVGGRVRRRAIRHRLDERRPLPCTRALERLARRLVHGEDVAAVDADAGHPVADRLVGQRLGARLGRQGRGDRPLVVVAEEDERRLHHGREVRTLVKRTLARRAVAEVRDRARGLALQLLPPRKPGRVRHV